MTLLSWAFGYLVWLRNVFFDLGLFRVRTLPGRVISVGNIAVGGTGKSPMIIAIAELLLARGQRPAILTRGYRSGLASGKWLVFKNGKVTGGNGSDRATPDEAIMQSTLLPDVPVIVGAKRWRAATAWLASGDDKAPTHWLLDDGFQHRWIHRDLDIVLLDADKPFGALLPKGRFREPTKSLVRAHAVVFTRATENKLPRVGDRSYVALLAPHVKLCTSEMIFSEPRLVFAGEHPTYSVQGGVWLVSGIGQPESFKKSTEQLGQKILGEVVFADHEKIDFARVRKEVAIHPGAIMMTEKDWARCAPFVGSFPHPIFVLPMRATLSAELTALI